MSILQNAIDSIILGVEDYQMLDEKRVISSTRNLLAGILLLFKYKLSELSPPESDEALIKKNTKFKLDSGVLTVVGDGSKTVDFDEIIKRFRDLDINGIDWQRLRQVQIYRNNIEHYYTTEPKESAKAMLSDCFIIIRDFIENILERDAKALLGEETWRFLISNSEVYEAERKTCLSSLETLLTQYPSAVQNAMKNYRCNSCQSDLLFSNIHDQIECKTCGTIIENHQDFLSKVLSSKYYSVYDASGDIMQYCPYCHQQTYIVGMMECLICGDIP